MRARVRQILTDDLEGGAAAGDGHLLLQVLAGPLDGPGEETFQVTLLTVHGLERMLQTTPFLLGRGFLISADLDVPKAAAFLRQRFEEPEAPSWPELTEKLGRIGLWEFEDYVP